MFVLGEFQRVEDIRCGPDDDAALMFGRFRA